MTRGLIVGAVVLVAAGAAAWALLRPAPQRAATDEATAVVEDPAAPPPAADGVAGLATVEGPDPAAIPGGVGARMGAKGKPWWETPAPPLTPAQEAALDALIARLADTEFHARIGALRELPRWGRHAEKALPRLLETLHDDRREIRDASVSILAWLGPVATPGLLALLAGDDLPAAASAANAIVEWPGIASTTVPALAEALKRQDRDLRIAVAQCLRRFGGDARFAIPALLDALSDPSTGVRSTVAETLGSLGLELPTVLPALVRMVSDPNEDADVRAAVGTVLGRLGPEAGSAAEALAKIAEEEAVTPRLAALGALAWLGKSGAAAVPALLRLSTHADGEFRAPAVAALSAIDPSRPDVLAALDRALRDEDSGVCTAAVKGLVRAGRAGWDLLVAGTSDPAVAARTGQAWLGPAPGQSTRAFLELCCALIDDGRPPLPDLAWSALSDRWPDDGECVPLLVQRYAAATKVEDRRRWLGVLIEYGEGTPAATAACLRALSDADHETYVMAATAIAWQRVPRTPGAMAKVLALLDDPAKATPVLGSIAGIDGKSLEPALPRIRELAKSGDADAKRIAEHILRRLAGGAPGPAATPRDSAPPPVTSEPPPPPPPPNRLPK